VSTQRNLIPAISHLSRQAKNIDEAIDLFQSLLTREVGGATLLVDRAEEGISPRTTQTIAAFMESRQFPFRGLYTAPVTVGARKAGRLVACFGSFGAPEKLLPDVTAHIARQLSEILSRTTRAIQAHAIIRAVPGPEAVL
jgi:hypothetical protein